MNTRPPSILRNHGAPGGRLGLGVGGALGAGRVVAAFAAGFIATITAPLLAIYVGAQIAYAICAFALLLGLYLVASSRGRAYRVVLGLILVGVSFASIAAASTVQGIVHGAPGGGGGGVTSVGAGTSTSTQLSVPEGRAARIDGWLITVKSVEPVPAVIVNGTVYTAPRGERLFIAHVEVVNNSTSRMELSDIWGFTIISNTSAEYHEARLSSLLVNPALAATAAKVNLFNPASTLPPKGRTSFYILFKMPLNEKPVKLLVHIGGPEARTLIIQLSS